MMVVEVRRSDYVFLSRKKTLLVLTGMVMRYVSPSGSADDERRYRSEAEIEKMPP